MSEVALSARAGHLELSPQSYGWKTSLTAFFSTSLFAPSGVVTDTLALLPVAQGHSSASPRSAIQVHCPFAWSTVLSASAGHLEFSPQSYGWKTSLAAFFSISLLAPSCRASSRYGT